MKGENADVAVPFPARTGEPAGWEKPGREE